VGSQSGHLRFSLVRKGYPPNLPDKNLTIAIQDSQVSMIASEARRFFEYPKRLISMCLKEHENQDAPLSNFPTLHILILFLARLPLALMPDGLLGGAAPWRGARDR
jgi:hypothetical protein